MATLYTLLVQGQAVGTVAPAGAIATASVDYHDDGSLHFVTAAGRKVTLNPTADLNELLKLVLVGVGGIPATKKFFGVS